MSEIWSGAAAALVGALIGGLLSVLGQELRAKRTLRERKRSIAYSIAAEIEAYLDIVKMRDHLSYARDILERNRSGIKAIPKSWLSPFEKKHSPFRVLDANLSHIGILGDICRDIATFYSMAMGVRITLMAADEGSYDHASPEDMVFILESEIELWENADRLGRQVVARLRQF